jgi:hypothetical protein
MSNKVELIVVKVLRSDLGGNNKIRRETHHVSNIESIREFFNKGNHGVDKSLPMTELTFKAKEGKEIAPIDYSISTKKEIEEYEEKVKKADKKLKLLLQEDYETLNDKIGAIKISD